LLAILAQRNSLIRLLDRGSDSGNRMLLLTSVAEYAICAHPASQNQGLAAKAQRAKHASSPYID